MLQHNNLSLSLSPPGGKPSSRVEKTATASSGLSRQNPLSASGQRAPVRRGQRLGGLPIVAQIRASADESIFFATATRCRPQKM
jgi:hypothetical protein